MRNLAGIACAAFAVPFALATIVFAAGAADPEADSAAWGLWAGAVLGLALTTAVLAVAGSALRARSERVRTWRGAGYWTAVGVSLGLVVLEVVSSALDELELDALYILGAAGLLVALTLLMVARVAWGVIAAVALALALAVLGFREGPYEPTVGFWLPRLLPAAAGLAALFLAVPRMKGR